MCTYKIKKKQHLLQALSSSDYFNASNFQIIPFLFIQCFCNFGGMIHYSYKRSEREKGKTEDVVTCLLATVMFHVSKQNFFICVFCVISLSKGHGHISYIEPKEKIKNIYQNRSFRLRFFHLNHKEKIASRHPW